MAQPSAPSPTQSRGPKSLRDKHHCLQHELGSDPIKHWGTDGSRCKAIKDGQPTEWKGEFFPLKVGSHKRTNKNVKTHDKKKTMMLFKKKKN